VEVGVTLHHPHGQIYAYPFVPPIAARELEMQRLHFERTGTNLLVDLLERELDDTRRLLYVGPQAVAFVPVCARYAYEIWITPRRPCPGFPELDAVQIVDLARALKTALLKLDELWHRPMPYILSFHQAPSDGRAHPEAQLHVQIYPAYRMPNRLKYLAGSEIGAGTFTADTLPERTALELAAVEVEL
jgi:UDPglucose--hexose-1-phosphate uridylyltransferase